MATKVYRLDSRDYLRQFEIALRNSKKTAVEFAEQESKLFLIEAIQITPPGKEGQKGMAAKRAGELTVENDLNRLFKPVGKGKGETAALGAKHRSARTSRGRVRKKPRRVWKVERGMLAQYIAHQKRRVGWLAAGLNQSAARFGYRPPAWVWRHQSPGAVSVRISSRGVVVRMTNGVSFASEVEGLERRFQRVLNLRFHKLRRRNEDFARRIKRGTRFR